MSALCFLDTETTGLGLYDDIWEIAAVRREPDGSEQKLHLFVDHDRAKCARMPEPFRTDHVTRWPDYLAPSRAEVSAVVWSFTEGAHIVGAVPNFDTERLGIMFRQNGLQPAWHYHLIDVENVIVGFLHGVRAGIRNEGYAVMDVPKIPPLPWKSDDLSRAVGVDPDKFDRHTAMGDVRWAMAQWDAMMAAAT